MSDYTVAQLQEWNEIIEKMAISKGLDFYEQEFELVSYEDMISYEAYMGMPSHYPHWSYGKAYERLKTLNRYNLAGLPYEMVINSNPCIAYLMKDNTLLLQILTIAHVYGHNDFIKNNRLFKSATRAEETISMFKNHAERIRSYISTPGIGYNEMEKVLNAAHSIRYQTCRESNFRKLSDEEKREEYLEKFKKGQKNRSSIVHAVYEEPDPQVYERIPFEPEEDILLFISKYGRLEEWQKDVLDIVRKETAYFIPQIETKIMNEGWASYWHYNILNSLDLSQELKFEFIIRHNQVIRPYETHLNPYYLGLKIFDGISRSHPDDPEFIFKVRELERDQSFIRRYLTRELCVEMNLFEYMKQGGEYVISEVSDEQGWEKIRDTLALTVGMGNIPIIRVYELIKKDNTLVLEHLYDGRELDLNYAHETLKHIKDLWNGQIVLRTYIDGRKKSVICDDMKKLTVKDE